MSHTPYSYMGSREEYENLLFSYAAGQLNETLSLMVATHLHFCGNARKLVETMEQVGGALLESHCQRTAVTESCFDKLLSRIESLEKSPPCAAKHLESQCKKTKEAIACLEKYGYGDDLIDFLMRKLPDATERHEENGARIFQIGCEKDAPDSEISYVLTEGRASGQMHTHEGLEITLILDGAIEDNGVTYQRGALLVADASIAHEPRSAGKTRCTCLVFSEHPSRLLGLVLSLLSLIL